MNIVIWLIVVISTYVASNVIESQIGFHLLRRMAKKGYKINYDRINEFETEFEIDFNHFDSVLRYVPFINVIGNSIILFQNIKHCDKFIRKVNYLGLVESLTDLDKKTLGRFMSDQNLAEINYSNKFDDVIKYEVLVFKDGTLTIRSEGSYDDLIVSTDGYFSKVSQEVINTISDYKDGLENDDDHIVDISIEGDKEVTTFNCSAHDIIDNIKKNYLKVLNRIMSRYDNYDSKLLEEYVFNFKFNNEYISCKFDGIDVFVIMRSMKFRKYKISDISYGLNMVIDRLEYMPSNIVTIDGENIDIDLGNEFSIDNSCSNAPEDIIVYEYYFSDGHIVFYFKNDEAIFVVRSGKFMKMSRNSIVSFVTDLTDFSFKYRELDSLTHIEVNHDNKVVDFDFSVSDAYNVMNNNLSIDELVSNAERDINRKRIK